MQSINERTQCLECRADELRTRWLALVAGRGGTLLGTFTGTKKRYGLRCANGHEWEVRGNEIGQGSWCPKCQHEHHAQYMRKTDGLKRLQATAAERGGRCLAEDYIGGSEFYLFECAKGHQWRARGARVAQGTWCAQCSSAERGQQTAERLFYRDGLERLHEAARGRGGECLASEYTGSRDRYRFRCAAGHEWTQEAGRVCGGMWCARCVKIAQRTPIEALQALAVEHGGRCLSPESLGARVKHTWECHRGHIWQSISGTIRRGSWCPNCAVLERTKNPAKRKRYDVGSE
ncbi:hypothetical protein [Caballeronia glebae]|uniref:hypothetical protein n=1 Tax=Caballeronia glebae TaxID=1777143 RepID=UPI0038B9DA4F